MLRFAGSIRRRFDIPPSPHSSASRIAPRSYRPGDAAMRGRPFEGYYLFLTYCGGELRRIPLLGTGVKIALAAAPFSWLRGGPWRAMGHLMLLCLSSCRDRGFS